MRKDSAYRESSERLSIESQKKESEERNLYNRLTDSRREENIIWTFYEDVNKQRDQCIDLLQITTTTTKFKRLDFKFLKENSQNMTM